MGSSHLMIASSAKTCSPGEYTRRYSFNHVSQAQDVHCHSSLQRSKTRSAQHQPISAISQTKHRRLILSSRSGQATRIRSFPWIRYRPSWMTTGKSQFQSLGASQHLTSRPSHDSECGFSRRRKQMVNVRSESSGRNVSVFAYGVRRG